MDNALKVNKEDISGFQFVSFDVLDNAEQRMQRKVDLEEAMKVSNTDKAKSIVYFMTEGGIRFVETTIWAVTDEQVVFKGGVFIPVNSVLKVI
jgi:hypothetical protein